MIRRILIAPALLAAIACGESGENTVPGAAGPMMMETPTGMTGTPETPVTGIEMPDVTAMPTAVVDVPAVDPAAGGAAGMMEEQDCMTLGTCVMPRPQMQVPNEAHPDMKVADRISETLAPVHNNQPMMLNGYLFLSGNARHSIWNIQDPSKPEHLQNLDSPNFIPGKEAESHMVAFAKYPSEAGDVWYAATTSGYGVDIWNFTDMHKAVHVGHAKIDGIDHGDVDNGVWGIAWQGKYMYIGGNNTGLHIIDVSDPSKPSVVKTLTNNQTGNFKAGTMFAMGDQLVISSSKGNGGVAMMDIADPVNPVLLNSLKTTESYISWFYGGYVLLQTPLRIYDVMSDPFNIKLVSTTETVASEYMSFGDDMMFLGQLRPNPGVTRYNMTDMTKPQLVERIPGRSELGTKHDDQFSLKVGNLLILSDDENITGVKDAVDGTYAGSYIALENPLPDTIAPRVLRVVPSDGGSALPTSSLGFAFSDQIEPATVGGPSLVVRPVGGGTAVSGKYGFMRTIVNFQPDEPMAPGEYEVILPKDGISDLGGNPIAEDFRSTFTVE